MSPIDVPIPGNPERWQDLANAYHIQDLIYHHDQYPQAWKLAQSRLLDQRDEDMEDCLEEAWDLALDQVYRGPRLRAWRQVRGISPAISDNIALTESLLSLVVYDEAGDLLRMTGSEIDSWARLSGSGAAYLLRPAIWAREISQDMDVFSEMTDNPNGELRW